MRVNNRTLLLALLLLWWVGSACSSLGAPGALKAEVAPGPQVRAAPQARVAPGRVQAPVDAEASAGSGVARSGAQDAGYFQHLLDQRQVPLPEEITVEGVLAQHSTPLPAALPDRALTLHPLLGLAVHPRSQEPAAILQLGMNSALDFSGLPRLAMNLCVVIDKSGSMIDEGKMEAVQEGLHLLLEALGPQDTLSVVAYDSRAHLVLPPTAVVDRAGIAALLEDIYPGGATNIEAGLSEGYRQLLQSYRPEAVNRMVFLSDGVATVGARDMEALLAIVEENGADREIGLSAIGVGTSFDHELMLLLARHGGGNFYFLRDRQRITTVFRDELETVLTPLAKNMNLTLHMEPGVEILHAHGLPLEETQGRPSLHIPTVYLSRRNGIMLLELELEDVLHRPGQRLGEVVLEYTLLEDDRTEVARYPIFAPAPERWDGDSSWFAHSAVRRNFDLLVAVYDMQEACDAWHRGDAWHARRVMGELVRQLHRESGELRDEGLARELQTAQRLLQAMGG